MPRRTAGREWPNWRRTGAALGVSLFAVSGLIVESPASAEVPTPGPTTAVITVQTGGESTDRGGAPTSLAGVELGLFDAPTASTPEPGFGTCVSDADGDCSFVVPQVGGENRDARFYVREIAAPTDYTPFIKVAGPAQVGGAGYASTVYAFETGPQLRAGSVYRSGQDFMADNTGEGFDGSSGVWPSVRDDPAVQANCSLNVALLIDTSEGGEAQTAAESVADSLAQLQVPSTVSIYPFANSVPSNNNQIVTGLTVKPGDSSAADRAISTLRLQPSTSNWDNVLSTYAQASASDDLAILITGPIPTASNRIPLTQGTQAPGIARWRMLENAVFSANEVKAGGTPIIAATPDGNDAPDDLAAVSGSRFNTDFFIGAGTDLTLGNVVKQYGQAKCRKTVTLQQQVIPAGGSIADATPGADFTYNLAGSGGLIGVQGRFFTGATGALRQSISLAPNTPASIGYTQQPPTGYSVVPVAGANATCVDSTTGTVVPASNNGATGFDVTVVANRDPIVCTVYDQAPPALLVTTETLASINGTPSGATVSPGDAVGYGVAVTNSGLGPGSTTLTAVVPANTRYGGTAEGWSCPTGSVAGTACTQTLTVGAGSSTTTPFTVTALSPLPTGTRSIVSRVTTSAGACSGCVVSLPTIGTLATSEVISAVNGAAATATTVLDPGDVVVYEADVANAGGSRASTTVGDVVPSGAAYTGTGEGWSCPAGTSPGCTDIVAVAAGATVRITFTVTLTNPLPAGLKTITNTVTSSAGSCASCVVSNPTMAALDTTLRISAVDGSPASDATTISPGAVVSYSARISNTGGSTGTTTLADPVPAGTTYSGTGEGWSCPQGSAATTSCSQLVTVASGSSTTVTFTITADNPPLAGLMAVADDLTSSSGSCSSCRTVNAIALPPPASSPVSTPSSSSPAAPTTVSSGPSSAATSSGTSPSAGANPSPPAMATTTQARSDGLAFTGARVSTGVAIAGALLGIGFALLIAGRSRRMRPGAHR